MPTARRATLDDLDLLVSHRQRMWEEMDEFTAKEHAEASRTYRRWLRPRLRSGRAAAFVVEGPGRRPLASGVVWLMEFQPRPAWHGTHQAYLMSVFTEPGSRRRGLAMRVTRAAMRWAKEQGAERMALHSSAAGMRLYRKVGFKRTHEMRITL